MIASNKQKKQQAQMWIQNQNKFKKLCVRNFSHTSEVIH